MQVIQHATGRTGQHQPVAPIVTRPKPSERRSREQQVVRKHERLVAAWLRSLSPR